MLELLMCYPDGPYLTTYLVPWRWDTHKHDEHWRRAVKAVYLVSASAGAHIAHPEDTRRQHRRRREPQSKCRVGHDHA